MVNKKRCQGTVKNKKGQIDQCKKNGKAIWDVFLGTIYLCEECAKGTMPEEEQRGPVSPS